MGALLHCIFIKRKDKKVDATTLISSIITGAFATLVCVLNNIASQKKRDIEQEKTLAVIQTEIKNLTSEVREHNNFAKRMPIVETKVTNLETEISKLRASVNTLQTDVAKIQAKL